MFTVMNGITNSGHGSQNMLICFFTDVFTSNNVVAVSLLTHWGRVTHICVSSDPTSIGSDNGLSPGRRQAIIRTNAGILLKGSLGTSFSEILIEILLFSFKKMHLKVSSVKRRPFCLSLNVLTLQICHILVSFQAVWDSYHIWFILFAWAPRLSIVYSV